jgi:glycosyltransferase involved in cell wall biosynthesis
VPVPSRNIDPETAEGFGEEWAAIGFKRRGACMKLLFWIPALGLGGGGSERVLSIVASGLARRGHQVVVASADLPGTASFYTFDIAVRRAYLGERPGASWHPTALSRLRRVLVRHRPDAAIGFMFAGYATLAAAGTGTGVPVVASEHTAFDHYRSRGIQSRLLLGTARRFAAFTIPSDRVRLGYPKQVAECMTVIPNPLPKAGAERVRREGERKRLLAVGNLRKEKGHSVLIDAFSRIAADYPDWDLRIIGDGPLRSSLNRAIEVQGLTGRAEIGEVVADIGAEYAQADLFVMPSSYESFGLATAEALAAGLPAVGFDDCPGTNEIIQDGVNGLLVPGPDRAEALAVGLSRLMGEPALLADFSSRAPGTVANYEAEGIVMRWEELLQSVVSTADARK